MSSAPERERRRGPARLLRAVAPMIRLGLLPLRFLPAPPARPTRPDGTAARETLTVFQAYMVGDLFMALPALGMLRAALPEGHGLQVLCRPDCAALLKRFGFEALAFSHPWFAENTLAALWGSLRGAWGLRGRIGAVALDTDGDPRTALLLRLMGAREAVSYARPQALFFTSLFPLPATASRHQSAKNESVARGFMADRKWVVKEVIKETEKGMTQNAPPSAPPHSRSREEPSSPRFLVLAWTRKDTKNWPLENWREVLRRMRERGHAFTLIDPPDGDAAWRSFAAGLEASGPEEAPRFARQPLEALWDTVQNVDAVIALDNFLGHMAAHAGKPVLWINGSSDAEAVAPRGPRGQATRVVEIRPMPCRPCGHRCTQARHAHCLGDLPIATVWHALEDFSRDLVQSRGISP